MMELDETALRQLMASRHGEACGTAILDGVAHGTPLEVRKTDGQVVVLTDTSDALNYLRELGWLTRIQISALHQQHLPRVYHSKRPTG